MSVINFSHQLYSITPLSDLQYMRYVPCLCRVLFARFLFVWFYVDVFRRFLHIPSRAVTESIAPRMRNTM